MKKIYIFLGFALLIVLSTQIFMFSSLQKDINSDKHYHQMSRQYYKIFNPYIPDSLFFANEKIPINHIIVRERLERELVSNMYRHSATILFLKRTGRFFPTIEPILKENNIPDDFKYLAVAESELANVISPAGAAGFWQFLKNTAIEYGLEISADVDERYNLKKATKAACSYLQSSKNNLGSWTMAAASYNMGLAGLKKRSVSQLTNDYFSLLLNEETSRYVYRILAMKLICEHPYDYGFFLRNKDIYQPIKIKVVNVSSNIDNLVLWAKDNKLSYLELKYANPWLRSDKLNVTQGKSYSIDVPLNFKYIESLSEIENPNKIFNDTIVVE